MSKPCLPFERKRKISEHEVICFDDIDNIDAVTYLSRVAVEASRLPDILEAKDGLIIAHDSQPTIVTGSAASALYLVSHRTVLFPPPTEDHLPKSPQHWKTTALSNFGKLRSFLEASHKPPSRLPVPPMKDRGGWHIFCVGNDSAFGNPGGYFGDDSSSLDDDDKSIPSSEVPEWKHNLPPDGYAPLVPLLLQMDQVMVRAVLHHLTFFLNEGFRLSEKLALWIFSLLARLEKPIHRDEAVMLYSLLKRLTILRKSQPTGSEELAASNLLILILVAYFEQGDSSALELPTSPRCTTGD